MSIVSLAPWVASTVFFICVWLVTKKRGAYSDRVWMVPATVSVLFLAWSLWAVIAEGPLGFWTEHSRNLWGNQIWFDLLIAIGVAWFMIVPEAKRLNMNLMGWLTIIVCTGCIGLSAMLARLLYLHQQAQAADPQPI
ncbi:MAG: DUF2834 domain-containing protein [Pseudomonadota bacterium]